MRYALAPSIARPEALELPRPHRVAARDLETGHTALERRRADPAGVDHRNSRNVRDALAPEIAVRGLTKNVEFSGFVTEEEKIRLFKASRVFLMPSKHEGSPRVIGESLIAVTPVVAYEIPNYRPLFGDFVRYAPPFDLKSFQDVANRESLRMRSGENYLDRVGPCPSAAQGRLWSRHWKAGGHWFDSAPATSLRR